ncbi:DegQ family serine endoprotease [bacterium]|nr:MAG: DegQ family serine endoprotease [bacterium]
MLRKYGTLTAILTGIIIGIILTANLNIVSDANASTTELPEFSQVFADVAESTMPSVVTITSAKIYEVPVRSWEPFMGDDFFDFFFGPRMRPKYEKREFKQEGLGSGVIVSEDGYILTNAHVIKDADEIEVHIEDDKYEAEVVGIDEKTDVAVLKIETARKLPAAKLGDSDNIRVGEWVLAIGSPFRLKHTVTSGIISAKGRSRMGIADYEDFIQTDAAINPGNSGGALVNLNGEVIGINTAIYSELGGNIGIGFAIPINMAKKVMDQLIDYGKVVRGWLGISIQNISGELAEALDIDEKSGVLVASVLPDSPAEDADLQRGDVIIAVDDQEIESVEQLRNKIAAIKPGTKVELKIIRDGKEIKKKVKLDEMPGEENIIAEIEQEKNINLGIRIRELSSSEAKKLGYDSEGILVTEVEPGSIADRAGVQPNDIIVELNRTRIRDTEDLLSAAKKIEKENVALFVVWREGYTIYLATRA